MKLVDSLVQKLVAGHTVTMYDNIFLYNGGWETDIFCRASKAILYLPSDHSPPLVYLRYYLSFSMLTFFQDQLDDLQELSEAYVIENSRMKKLGYPGEPIESSLFSFVTTLTIS